VGDFGIRSRDGQTNYKVRMADNVAVRGVVKASFSDIKQVVPSCNGTVLNVTDYTVAVLSEIAAQPSAEPPGPRKRRVFSWAG
jgi:hypothetical protein